MAKWRNSEMAKFIITFASYHPASSIQHPASISGHQYLFIITHWILKNIAVLLHAQKSEGDSLAQ